MNKYEAAQREQDDRYAAGPKKATTSQQQPERIPIQKPIPFSDLDEEDRIRVLETMADGINSGLDFLIHGTTHQHFLMSLHNGVEFNPVALWSALPVSSQNHFRHARKALKTIEAMLYPEPITTDVEKPIAQPQNKGKKRKR